MDFSPLESLINVVGAINRKYDRISELSGENFNIFRILKIEASEVRLHSAFIAELLNPKGSHGQGDIFLRLFVERFNYKSISFQSESAKIHVEKHAGFLDTEKLEGGRIDILLTDANGKQFIIENKIYAPDQKNQLVRYYNYNPEANLIYLCLFGGEVSKITSGNLPLTAYKVISYENDITDWLIACKKEAVDHPILREGISQYLNLVKYLTGKLTNQIMSKELGELLISSYERLDSAFTIANALDEAVKSLIRKLELLIQEISNELDLECSLDMDFNKKYTGFYFWRKDWEHVSVAFQFRNYDRSLIYGVLREHQIVGEPDEQTLNIISRLASLNGKYSEWWPSYHSMEAPFENWTEQNREPWLAILDGSFKENIKSKVSSIICLLPPEIKL